MGQGYGQIGNRTGDFGAGYGACHDLLATDLDGPFLTSQHAARRMSGQGRGMFTKLLALELAEHGITVNAVAPGESSTEMTGQDEAEAYAQERPGNPVGRPGHVNEVASVIGFLASPRSTYVTGSSYAVDGGLMLMPAHGHDSATGWREV